MHKHKQHNHKRYNINDHKQQVQCSLAEFSYVREVPGSNPCMFSPCMWVLSGYSSQNPKTKLTLVVRLYVAL